MPGPTWPRERDPLAIGSPPPSAGGTLALLLTNIDEVPAAAGTGAPAAVLDWLLERAGALALPLTCALADPGASPLGERLLSARPVHEIALSVDLPDGSLTAERAAGLVFDRWHRARQSGHRISTAVHWAGSWPRLDALARLGIKVLVTRGAAREAPADGSPPEQPLKPDDGQGASLLRHGIRQVRLSESARRGGWLAGWSQSWRRRAAWRRLANEGGLEVEAISLASLVDRRGATARAVERRLESLAVARQTLGLGITTLAEWDATTRRGARRRPAASILRRGAA